MSALEPPTDDRQPVMLRETDRRRLYRILEEDIVGRLRRIEIGGVLLTAAVASPKLGGPSVGELAAALLHLLP